MSLRRVVVLLLSVTLAVASVMQVVVPGPARQVAAAPARTGTLTISDWQFPTTLNPLVGGGVAVSRRIIDMMWDPLVRFDEHADPFADLAQQLPTDQNGLVAVANGTMTVTITLKPSLKWSDGQPMTSADVLFGWQVYSSQATGPACAGTCSGITSIDTPDAATAVIHFDHVYGNYLVRLPPVLPAHAFSSVQDAAQKLGSAAYNYESTSYVTSGPYQVSQFAKDDRIVLVPNPNYAALVGPYLSSVTFAFYSDKNAMIASGTQQTVDETEDYTPADIAQLQQHSSQYSLSIVPSHLYEQLRYNVAPTYNGQPNPLADAEVRQALSMAIDRHALCLALSTPDSACSQMQQEGPITKASAMHVAPQGLPYDPAHAKTLLAGSAYTGQTLDLVMSSASPYHDVEATFLNQAWTAIGVHTDVQFVAPTQLFSTTGTLATSAFQLAIYGIADDLYPDSLVNQYGSQFIPAGAALPNNANYGHVNDPQLDALLNDAATTVNEAQRQTDFQQFDQRVVDQAYMLALYNDPFIATADSAFGHFYPSGSGSSWNAFEWYNTTAQATPVPRFNAPSATPVPTSTPTPSPTATATPLPARMQLSSSVVTAGTSAGVTVSGGGFDPGDAVTVQYVARTTSGTTRTVRVTAPTFGNGTFVVSNLPVPADLKPGTYQVSATGQPSGKRATISLSVVSASRVVPRVTITKVLIDRSVQGKQQDTTRLQRGERATFIVLYRVIANHVTPTASLRVTRSGKLVGTWSLKAVKIGSQRGFGATLTMSGSLSQGDYVAHWSVRLGTTTLTRNRPFQVARP